MEIHEYRQTHTYVYTQRDRQARQGRQTPVSMRSSLEGQVNNGDSKAPTLMTEHRRVLSTFSLDEFEVEDSGTHFSSSRSVTYSKEQS